MAIQFFDNIFIPFLLISLLVYWLLNRNTKWQNLWIFFASLFFYGFDSIMAIFLLIGYIIFNYFTGLFIESRNNLNRKKQVLFFGIVINVLFLGLFKYFNFLSGLITTLLNILGFHIDPITLNLLVPIGISFFTLQTIGYHFDIFNGKIKAIRNFLSFSIFITFFPKVIAGPIERASNIIVQIEAKKSMKGEHFSSAIELLLIGFFKKIVIADLIADLISSFYSNPGIFSASNAIANVFLYSLNIYADFSGYSDIAKGVSRLFGIEITTNFKQPYLSTSPREFWQGWHISFSTWLRDYIYFPLGGSRKSKGRVYINLLIVMILSGLWHGAGINFLIWGLLHGCYMILTRFSANIFKERTKKMSRFCRITTKSFTWLVTFCLVSFAWIFFRAPSLDSAIIIISKIFDFKGYFQLAWLIEKYRFILLFTPSLVFTFDLAQKYTKKDEFLSNLPWFIRGIIYAALFAGIMFFRNIFFVPFIYAGF